MVLYTFAVTTMFRLGGMCQSNIHMNGRAQGLPAKHQTASTGLPSVQSASWSHAFQR